jgi:hypothetical protein
VSRSRRVVAAADGPADLWAVVDAWAAEAVDPVGLRARWSARAVPVRGLDHFVDVTGDAERAAAALRSAGVGARPIRPARRALGRTGEVAYPDDRAVVTALTAGGVDHRVVTRARRYRWRGPLTGPTLCEISTEPEGTATIEAWHEPVWTDTFRLGATSDADRRRRPRRLVQARAAINRLLGALGAAPLGGD